MPPPGYFAKLWGIRDRHGILITADEVQTGPGRLGTLSGSTAVGLRPDTITLAMGLGGMGMPVGAVVMRPERDVLDSYEHSFTSGANPLALAAAEATIGVVAEGGFLDRVRRHGAAWPLLRRQSSSVWPGPVPRRRRWWWRSCGGPRR